MCNKFKNNNESKNFIINKYGLSNMQKFIIYKEYLIREKLDLLVLYLLEESKATIIDQKKIDFEYVLIYIETLLYNEISINNLSKEVKELLNNILSSLIKKNEIRIRKDINININPYKKIIDKFDLYNSDDINRENILFFLLIYNQIYHIKNFNDIYVKIQKKKEILNFIRKNKNIFSNLKCENLKMIYEKANKEETSINDVLILASNSNEYISFFCSVKKDIINKCVKIKFDKIPELDGKTNIKLLESFINELIEMNVQLEKSDYDTIERKFLMLINVLKTKEEDYNKLNELKNIILKYDDTNIPLFKKILEKVYNALHDLGKSLIEKHKWNNIEILNYLQEDVKVSYKEHKSDPRIASLIKFINLDEINEDFCKKFIGNINDPYDYKKQFNKNYNVFISSLVKNAKTYNHLTKLYKIFNIESIPRQSEDIIKNLVDIFGKDLERNGMEFCEIEIIIYTLYKLVSDNRDYCAKSIIKNTKNVLNEREVNHLFLFIIDNFSDDISESLCEKLIININDMSDNKVIETLKQTKSEKIKIKIIEKLESKVIKEEDVFNVGLTDELELLQNIIKLNDLQKDNKNFINVSYIKKTREVVNNIIKKLRNLEFCMNQIESMYNLYEKEIDKNRNLLQDRFQILSFGDIENITTLYERTVNTMNYCITKSREIDEIINVFSNYYPNEKHDIIDNYKELKKQIINNPICDFPDDGRLEIYNFKNIYHEAHQITKFKNSKIFIIINEIKKKEFEGYNDEIFIFEETKNEFLNLKVLFNSKTENKIKLDLLESIIKDIEKSEVEKEVNILLDILDIEKTQENRVIEKLSLLKNKDSNIRYYENIILLLEDFKLNGENLRAIFRENKTNLENYSSLYDLIKINDSLNLLNLNILDLNSNDSIIALEVMDKMYEEPKLMEFIKDKQICDVHSMGEFIDDSEDNYLTYNDIDQLETCIEFQKELTKKNIFIDIIKSNSHYHDIGLKFENSSGKFSDFNELFTNHLNPNELNKAHIKSIYNDSKIDLKNNYPEYKCEVSYKNNGKYVIKNYDELSELRTIALLKKGEVYDEFANIITNIQDILKLLKTISSKGYFEDIEYTIDIKNGNALASKSKYNDKNETLTEVINELNIILNHQKI
ncbi:hypothetical protein BCR36DRAFT_460280 [Piromyces finnis]|uniref:Uncharacterized protein n=1 Tax=Piromyces finnis TaxID=1754191 RepID=A0A1Y1UZY6_9FUNG|nr:hypothetical protein BCR36DRAFT_460280 [Piromyces finnis]|eukprot:ORX43670.1 hypothetical protein BCR36DRAFT_460280 [Piromyces finnis]